MELGEWRNHHTHHKWTSCICRQNKNEWTIKTHIRDFIISESPFRNPNIPVYELIREKYTIKTLPLAKMVDIKQYTRYLILKKERKNFIKSFDLYRCNLMQMISQWLKNVFKWQPYYNYWISNCAVPYSKLFIKNFLEPCRCS